MNLVEYPDREFMMMDLADKLSSELGAHLRTEDRATLAVPGGTTPGPIFDVLSGVDLGWDRIDVLLTDERWVPETSDRSNTALLRRRLLVDKAAAARLLPLYADTPAPEDSLAALAAAIEPALPITVLLLGMGADMHCASLFPGADLLEQALAPDAPVLLPMRAPGAPEPRITLTAPVLKAALNIHILITGAEKREAVEKARHLTPAQAPVAAVLGQATVHWAE
jgi:6-phosphogluconolactonase